MYEFIRKRIYKIVEKRSLFDLDVKCSLFNGKLMRLPSKEYMAARGEEVVCHCEIDGGCGQAFSQSPREFCGTVRTVLEMGLKAEWERAVFFAMLNAILHKLGLISGTVHCVGREPELCGVKMAEYTVSQFGYVKVAHIGYQPGHVKALARTLGSEMLYVTDLDPRNIGKLKFGVRIIDGALNSEILRKVDVAYITGSAATNGSLPELLNTCNTYGVKPIIYGVTGKGLAKLLNLESFCVYAHNSLKEALTLARYGKPNENSK